MPITREEYDEWLDDAEEAERLADESKGLLENQQIAYHENNGDL